MLKFIGLITVENLAIALISFSQAAFDVVSGRLP
jgi:hypothetical protein